MLDFNVIANFKIRDFILNMQISNITTKSQNFGANLNSPKLKFKSKDFFVNINGFGKNIVWAHYIKDTANTTVSLIRKDTTFENILRFVTAGVTKANKYTLDILKKEHTGILRTSRKDWRCNPEWHDIITEYGDRYSRYNSYAERLDRRIFYPLRNPYPDINLTKPIAGIDKTEPNYLLHGSFSTINAALDYVGKLYKNVAKYVKMDVKPEHLEDINNNIAEIRWVIAHATPWERGSDAIANVFIRSIYKALGVKATPLKKGISLDLEAYCTNLSEYKKNFPNYFEKSPTVIM